MQTTFPRLLLDHAQRRPDAPAMREKEYGIWQTTSWSGMARLVEAIAWGLHQAGLTEEPARTGAATVTFESGARTAWHTHPLDQTLVVTSGCGRAQSWGGPIEAIRPGDVIRFAPGEKHWHGAGVDTAVTHIAIQESLDGKAVEWLEHVSDEQYLKGDK